ncbi:uncharacterized protein LOC144425059 [Styela clava]
MLGSLSSYFLYGIICESLYLIFVRSLVVDAKAYSLNITSVMMHHKLIWELPDSNESKLSNNLRYTVYYKMVENDEWRFGFDCVDVDVNYCDLEKSIPEIFPEVEYWFKVTGKVSGSPTIVYNTSEIRFIPEHDTILVPPNFTLTYVDDVIFVRPIIHALPNGKRIDDHIQQLTHQVKYWPFNNKTQILYESVEELGNEISLQVSGTQEYCVSVRLYAEDVGSSGTPKTIYSAWSDPPSCIKPPTVASAIDHTPVQLYHDETSETVKFVCIATASILFVMLASYAAYQTRRKCKFMFEKGQLPAVTLRVLQESEIDPFSDVEIRTSNNYMSQEDVDSLHPDYLGLTTDWPSSSPMLQLKCTDADYQSGSSIQYVSETETEYLPELFYDRSSHESEATSRINMTYGIGSYVHEPTVDYSPDLSERLLLMTPTLRTRLDIGEIWESSPGEARWSPFLFGDDVLDIAQLRQSTGVWSQDSTSLTTLTDMDLLFDVQRFFYPSSPISNIYLGSSSAITTPILGNRHEFETFNVAYSRNPSSEVPDLLSNDYINI